MEATSDQQLLSPEERVVIQSAQQRLVATCMEESGFDYPVTPVAELVVDAPLYLSPAELQGMVAVTESGLAQTEITAELIVDVANTGADCQEVSGIDEVREDSILDAREAIVARLDFEMSQYIAFQHAVWSAPSRFLDDVEPMYPTERGGELWSSSVVRPPRWRQWLLPLEQCWWMHLQRLLRGRTVHPVTVVGGVP